MRETVVARRYAKAAFDLAIELDRLEEVRNDMIFILETGRESKDLRLMFRSPAISAEKKKAAVNAVFKGHIGEFATRFMNLIIVNRREAAFLEIAKQYNILYKAHRKITTTWIKTPVEIDDEIREKVVRIMEDHTQGKVELIEKVDEDLLGGFVLNYEDKQYDASLRREINRLKKEFEKNPFVIKY